MEHLLSFFEALLIFTGGLLVAIFWLAIIMFVSVEVWDFFFEKDDTEEEEN